MIIISITTIAKIKKKKKKIKMSAINKFKIVKYFFYDDFIKIIIIIVVFRLIRIKCIFFFYLTHHSVVELKTGENLRVFINIKNDALKCQDYSNLP